jgi:hypothetical protein
MSTTIQPQMPIFHQVDFLAYAENGMGSDLSRASVASSLQVHRKQIVTPGEEKPENLASVLGIPHKLRDTRIGR